MGSHLVRITDTKAFEELTDRSKERPVVIFKHSLTCPISAAAYQQMEQFNGDVALVEVQKSRALSTEIESRLGVAHESPQVIVLSKGQVAITAEAVTDAVRNAASKSQDSVSKSNAQ